MRQRYVIVGANLAGGTTAITLREEGFDGEIELIGAESHPPYERRTVGDADRIRAASRSGARAVLVGMAFIGSEVAASLRYRGVEVAVIEPFKTPLYRVLGEEIGRVFAQLHRENGVQMFFEES